MRGAARSCWPARRASGSPRWSQYAIDAASEFRVLRVAGVESEMAFGYAGVHQLVLPILDRLDELPEPQRAALDAVLGRVQHDALDPFLVGLAVLSLVAEAARDQPVLVVIDDAQWLDDESAMALSFVGRRLHAERVAMLVAMRDTPEHRGPLRRPPPARPRRDSPTRRPSNCWRPPRPRPLTTTVASRIVAATGGNPLALVELPAALTVEQLRGAAPLPDPLPIGERLSALFAARVRGAGRRRTDGAAAGGRRAAGRSAAPAPRRRRDRRACRGTRPSPRRRRAAWSHSPRRSSSAIPSCARRSTTRPRAADRRRAHAALAGALDAERDADRRAWHLGAAAAGPDERVARALEASAERARPARRRVRGCAATCGAPPSSRPIRERAAERLLEAARAELVGGHGPQAREILERAQGERARRPTSTPRRRGRRR